jgi:hypothetical protein
MELQMKSIRRLGLHANFLVLSAASWVLLGGCTTVPSSHWNVHQLHELNGSPRHVGELHNGFQQALVEFVETVDFKVPFIEPKGSTDKIKDPLGRCLHNLNGLLGEETNSELWRARKANVITWLSAGCTYSLSRERCALALGPLAKHYGLRGPIELDETRPYVSASELSELLDQLILAATPELLHPAQEIPPSLDIAERCRYARGLNYNRDGARRLLMASAALVERASSNAKAREALQELRQELGSLCLGLALRSALQDPSAEVQAAGYGAWIEITEGLDSRPYSLLLKSGRSLNIQEAVRGFAKYGMPPLPERSLTSQSSIDPRAAEKYWTQSFIVLLNQIREGPAAVALCHGISQITGLPENLRPEHWIAWHLDREALLENTESPTPSAADKPITNSSPY